MTHSYTIAIKSFALFNIAYEMNWSRHNGQLTITDVLTRMYIKRIAIWQHNIGGDTHSL